MIIQSFTAFSLLLLWGLATPLSAQWKISQSPEANRLGASVKSSTGKGAQENAHSSELVFFIDGKKVWTGALISDTDLSSITSIETQSNIPSGRPRTLKMRFWNLRKGTGMANKSVLLFSIAFPDLKSISKLTDQALVTTTTTRRGRSESHLFTLDQLDDTVQALEGAIRKLGLAVYLK